MSKAAQLAQGSKFYKGSSSIVSEQITSIATGYPTILGMTGHDGLANGDYVFLTGFQGADANGYINDLSVVVKYKLARPVNDLFAVDLDTTGRSITVGAASVAQPSQWVQIKEIKSIKPAGGTAPKIDVTDLDSVAKEFDVGLLDNGTITFEYFDKPNDPGQAGVLEVFKAQLLSPYKLVLTGGSTRTFEAVCLKFYTNPDVSVDGVQNGSFDLQLSGAVVAVTP